MCSAPLLEAIIDGNSDGETLFFLQGWPDDHTLWDAQVAALRDRYRCVRVDMPNYGATPRARWGYTTDEIVEGIAACIRSVSPSAPVTLVMHDWGAYWGAAVHKRYPDLASRLVGCDVAPHMEPSPAAIAGIIVYQWWLLAAFALGGPVGAWMTRFVAERAGAPKAADADAWVNYPYRNAWGDLVSGREKELYHGYWPKVPILFAYGADKAFPFHSERWLEHVRSQPFGKVAALEGGHWVPSSPSFTPLLVEWLEATPAR